MPGFPSPTLQQVHADGPLTSLIEGYRQGMNKFNAHLIFPGISVRHKSDTFYKFYREDFWRAQMLPIAPGAVAEDIGYRLNTGTYTALEYAIRHTIPDSIRYNADPQIDLDFNAVELLTMAAMTSREQSWADTYFVNSVWGTSIAGAATYVAGTQTVYWSSSGSDPIGDVNTGRAVMHTATGIDPNILVLGYNTRQKLDTNPQIIDRLKYGQTAPGPVQVTDSALAQLFRVDRVVTLSGIKATSAVGAATPTFGNIAGANHALLTYAAPGPGQMVASAGYTFNWQRPGATANGFYIKRFRLEERSSDVIQIEQAYAHALVSPELGYFFNDIVQ